MSNISVYPLELYPMYPINDTTPLFDIQHVGEQA